MGHRPQTCRDVVVEPISKFFIRDRLAFPHNLTERSSHLASEQPARLRPQVILSRLDELISATRLLKAGLHNLLELAGFPDAVPRLLHDQGKDDDVDRASDGVEHDQLRTEASGGVRQHDSHDEARDHRDRGVDHEGCLSRAPPR